MRTRLLMMVAALVLVGVAVVAAQDRPRSPNERAEATRVQVPAEEGPERTGFVPNEPEAELVPEAPVVASGSGRRFLATANTVGGSAALAACPAGFHMANLLEILDVTNLVYAGARVRSDQGGGPPANWYGWVHTGGSASVAKVAGEANCNLWTSSNSAHYGTIVGLNPQWTDAAVAVSPWDPVANSCSMPAAVWCVED